jgi:DNA-directed RNA polymerase I subunit RPA1
VRCSNGYTFRKEGYTKVIEYDLTAKMKLANEALGLQRRDVLLSSSRERTATRAGRDDPASDDSDTEGSELEEGDATFYDEVGGQPEQEQDRLPRAANDRVKSTRGRNERVMAPEECRAHLRLLFANDKTLCSLIFGRHGPLSPMVGGLSVASADMFFMDVVPVSPTRFRPPAKMGETLFENPHNELLTKMLTTSYRLRDLNTELRTASAKTSTTDDDARRKILGTLLETLFQLQVDVNSFIDSGKNTAKLRNGKLPPPGIKQVLEKKEGLFRMHMMVRAHVCNGARLMTTSG